MLTPMIFAKDFNYYIKIIWLWKESNKTEFSPYRL